MQRAEAFAISAPFADGLVSLSTNSWRYGTGGWGFAHFGRSLLVNGVAQMTGDADENGYVIGGGLEYALFPHLSVKGEYQYFHFSDYNPSGPVIPPNGITVSANPQNDSFHTIRFGINYKF